MYYSHRQALWLCLQNEVLSQEEGARLDYNKGAWEYGSVSAFQYFLFISLAEQESGLIISADKDKN